MALASSPLFVEQRREQIFPVLTPAQIESARRFGGPLRQFNPGDIVFALGAAGAPSRRTALANSAAKSVSSQAARHSPRGAPGGRAAPLSHST